MLRHMRAVVTEREPRTETFEDFYRSEHIRLFRALFLITGHKSEAEELMQEAFLKVWERWDRVRSFDDPQGYLYRTAMNAFRSRYRQATRRARVMVGLAPAEDAFATVDTRRDIVQALARLTPRQRAALVLTEMLGYGSEEAGSLLGVRAVTVRSLTSQARATLRRTLDV